jgi:hypothetical protein
MTKRQCETMVKKLKQRAVSYSQKMLHTGDDRTANRYEGISQASLWAAEELAEFLVGWEDKPLSPKSVTKRFQPVNGHGLLNHKTL